MNSFTFSLLLASHHYFFCLAYIFDIPFLDIHSFMFFSIHHFRYHLCERIRKKTDEIVHIFNEFEWNISRHLECEWWWWRWFLSFYTSFFLLLWRMFFFLQKKKHSVYVCFQPNELKNWKPWTEKNDVVVCRD